MHCINSFTGIQQRRTPNSVGSVMRVEATNDQRRILQERLLQHLDDKNDVNVNERSFQIGNYVQ